MINIKLYDILLMYLSFAMHLLLFLFHKQHICTLYSTGTYVYNSVLWIRNDYFCSGSRLGSGSNSYYLSVLGNYFKRHLKFNQKEEYTNDLPFSISYYSPHSTLSPELEIKFLFICSFFFCWIRIRNNNSRSRKKFRIHADPDPQH